MLELQFAEPFLLSPALIAAGICKCYVIQSKQKFLYEICAKFLENSVPRNMERLVPGTVPTLHSRQASPLDRNFLRLNKTRPFRFSYAVSRDRRLRRSIFFGDQIGN